jgi:hypothetical protein
MREFTTVLECEVHCPPPTHCEGDLGATELASSLWGAKVE